MKLLGSDDIQSLKTNAKVGLITLLVAFPPYMLVNNFLYDRSPFDLMLPIDRFFPFDHHWILVYAWVYIFLFLPIFIVKDAGSFRFVAKGYIILNYVSVVVFLLLPARYPRPEIPTQTEFLWWGTALNYLLDKPVNCFPSLHVANAFFASMIAFHYRPRVGVVAWLLAALIGVSTLYMKQHFIADVLMGFILAFIVYRFYFRKRAYRDAAAPLPEWLSAGVIVVYLSFIGLMYLLFSLGVKLPLDKIIR